MIHHKAREAPRPGHTGEDPESPRAGMRAPRDITGGHTRPPSPPPSACLFEARGRVGGALGWESECVPHPRVLLARPFLGHPRRPARPGKGRAFAKGTSGEVEGIALQETLGALSDIPSG